MATRSVTGWSTSIATKPTRRICDAFGSAASPGIETSLPRRRECLTRGANDGHSEKCRGGSRANTGNSQRRCARLSRGHSGRRGHEPYMPPDELQGRLPRLVFWVAEQEGRLAGVMGIQDKGDVALVRHAYVASNTQRSGCRHETPSPRRRACREADPDWYLGDGIVGDRLLSTQRIHCRLERGQRPPPPKVLVDSRTTDRNVRRPRQPTMVADQPLASAGN